MYVCISTFRSSFFLYLCIQILGSEPRMHAFYRMCTSLYEFASFSNDEYTALSSEIDSRIASFCLLIKSLFQRMNQWDSSNSNQLNTIVTSIYTQMSHQMNEELHTILCIITMSISFYSMFWSWQQNHHTTSTRNSNTIRIDQIEV